MKVNLFALTGLGNPALKILKEMNIDIVCLYTRKELGEFPYYKEKNIELLAKELNIAVRTVDADGVWTVNDKVDINLVVSFHRILEPKHIKQAKVSLNIHPSLLPSYRGPTPTNWMIYNQEKRCGITVHKLTNNIDKGEIIYQESYPLTKKTDTLLRKFLATKISKSIKDVFDKYPNWTEIKNSYKESYYQSFYKEQGKYNAQ